MSPSAAEGLAAGRVTVDLDALARNFRKLAIAVAPAACAAVVKADAYGLGLLPVARRLHREGCRRFFVATAAEGSALRTLLDDVSIFVLEGAVTDAGVAALEAARLTPVLNSLEQVERWLGGAVAAGLRPAAALHVDTGMTRLGMSEAEVRELAGRRDWLSRFALELVMTHLACADEPEHPLNDAQVQRFGALRAMLPAAPTSIGNSAGALTAAARCGDIARPGIALYGGNPFVERDNPMEPVVTLEGRIVQLRSLDAAATVGYGATYAARSGERLAVIGIGYADGYPRRLGNSGAVAIASRRVPIVGRVSMDLLCVDVSNIDPKSIRVGDWAELIGPNVPLEELAAAAGTINYEILTGLSCRLERRYLEREQ
jgi:alanine racemase